MKRVGIFMETFMQFSGNTKRDRFPRPVLCDLICGGKMGSHFNLSTCLNTFSLAFLIMFTVCLTDRSKRSAMFSYVAPSKRRSFNISRSRAENVNSSIRKAI